MCALLSFTRLPAGPHGWWQTVDPSLGTDLDPENAYSNRWLAEKVCEAECGGEVILES